MKTRIKKSTSKNASQTPSASTKAPLKELDPSVAQPPQIFVLPKGLSNAARIVTLPNPGTATLCRYLICPERGCYEFTRVAAPKKACRSWLLAPDRVSCDNADRQGSSSDPTSGYVLQSPDLMIATPLDPLFLILPALAQDAQVGGRPFFLSFSDYTERLQQDSQHLREVMRLGSNKLERLFEARISDVCSSMDDGTETLYMLSTPKLLQILIRKAENLVQSGLPESLEDRFVKQALAVPLLSVRREDSDIQSSNQPSENFIPGAENESGQSTDLSQDSQTSTATSASSTSTAATSITSESNDTAPGEDIVRLQRLRTALNFILQSYIPASLRATLDSALSNADSGVDFEPLDKHLARLDQLKKEALALRSLSDNISRKRSAADDDEALEKAEAKKRKKEEEELKKKNTSRGVKQLEKADRSGMKTLSSFFTKAAPTKS